MWEPLASLYRERSYSKSKADLAVLQADSELPFLLSSCTHLLLRPPQNLSAWISKIFCVLTVGFPFFLNCQKQPKGNYLIYSVQHYGLQEHALIHICTDKLFNTWCLLRSSQSCTLQTLWFSEVITIFLVRLKIQNNCSLATGIQHLYLQSETWSFLLSGWVGIISKTLSLMASTGSYPCLASWTHLFPRTNFEFSIQFSMHNLSSPDHPYCLSSWTFPQKKPMCALLFLSGHRPRIAHASP